MDIKPANELPSFETLFQSLMLLPTANILAIVAGFALWIIGGNILGYRSMKRRGTSYSKSLLPTPSGLRAVFGMNKAEWLLMIILAVFSLSLISWGISSAYH